jgi:hypothetical protein
MGPPAFHLPQAAGSWQLAVGDEASSTSTICIGLRATAQTPLVMQWYILLPGHAIRLRRSSVSLREGKASKSASKALDWQRRLGAPKGEVGPLWHELFGL